MDLCKPRGQELLTDCDIAGAAIWRAIIRTIEDLQRATPRDGEAVS
jgi:hypothetical protein